ncbi:MAG: heme-binding protein [Chloroflexota bacterium]|nr:heme-binding protein [Chloroflexota bacterium]
MMYNKAMLSLNQTQAAMSAMISKATQEPDRPVTISIVDDRGNLLSYARMDNCATGPQTLATRKAYTAAMRRMDSATFAETLKKNGQSVSDFGDHSLVAVQGAVVIVHPETKAILGGIGISGLSSQEDEDLARLGLEALGL